MKDIVWFLGVPVKILRIERDSSMAEVELDGIRRQVSIRLIDNASVGDYVLVHAGFAIETIDEEQALETLGIIRKMSEDS